MRKGGTVITLKAVKCSSLELCAFKRAAASLPLLVAAAYLSYTAVFIEDNGVGGSSLPLSQGTLSYVYKSACQHIQHQQSRSERKKNTWAQMHSLAVKLTELSVSSGRAATSCLR